VNLYEDLVEALAEERGMRPDSAEFGAWLRSLQDPARSLRASYRVNQVRQTYGDDSTRLAYVLLYFSHYARFLPTVLDNLRVRSFPVPAHPGRLLSFGTGPGSELAGWMCHLARSEPGSLPKFIECVANDRQDDGWKGVRTPILRSLARRKFHGRPPLIRSRVVDFCQPWNALSLELVSDYDLVLFQNCLNEIPESARGAFVVNVASILGNLRPGASLLFLDLEVGKYSAIKVVMDQIGLLMAGRSDLAVARRQSLSDISNDPLPRSIRQYFLDGSDRMRPRGPVGLSFVACTKRCPGEPV